MECCPLRCTAYESGGFLEHLVEKVGNFLFSMGLEKRQWKKSRMRVDFEIATCHRGIRFGGISISIKVNYGGFSFWREVE